MSSHWTCVDTGTASRAPQTFLRRPCLTTSVSPSSGSVASPRCSSASRWEGGSRSLGAVARPELVECLVVAEAGPEGTADGGEMKADEVEMGLEEWPVPFPDLTAAEAYFSGPGSIAGAWARGLRRAPDGLHPRFEVDVLTRMVRTAVAEDCWAAWSRVGCPTLIVRGARSSQLRSEEVSLMLSEMPGAKCVELPSAAHEVHLEDPAGWRVAVSGFLDEVPRR
jgi:pimeloyl-ACP methyl ester carboxylesterase